MPRALSLPASDVFWDTPPHIAITADSRATARGLLRQVRSEVAVSKAEGNDWRIVVDSLRPVTQTLWRALGDSERARFVRHLAPRWDVHRHRVAPQIDDLLQDCATLGSAGRRRRPRIIARRPERNDRGIVPAPRCSGAETLQVHRVINCTGPARDVRLGSSHLLRSMIAARHRPPGPLALGLDVADSGALIRQDGGEHDRIYAIGPLLKERLWETTAVASCATRRSSWLDG